MSFWATMGPTLMQGGISAGGNLFSARENRRATESARRWAEFMSGTEIQRRVQDLKAAGINPMLAAMDGAGTPNVPPSSVPDYGRSSGEGASAYFNAKRLENETKVADAQARLVNAQAKNTEDVNPWTAAQAELSAHKLRSEINKLNEEVKKIEWESANLVQDEYKKRMTIELIMDSMVIANQSAQLDQAEKKALSDFWERAGEAGKGVPVIMDLLKAAKAIFGGK